MRGHAVIIDQGKVDDPALVCIHGSKSHTALLARTLGSGQRDAAELLLTARLIALDVHDDRIVEVDVGAHERGEDHLESIERATVAADEHGKVSAVDIEDELAVIAIVLIDGRMLLTKKGKDLPKIPNCHVGDLIHLVVGQGLASLVTLPDGCELVVLRSIADVFLG